MHKKSRVATALTAALCAIAFNAIPGAADEQAAKPPIELVDAQRVAPNFVGIDNWLNSAPLNIADLRGKVVVLNFWASWCPPCVEETQSLNRLQQEIAAKGGVVLGVSVDEDAAAYDKFLQDNHVVFPTYRDATKKRAADYGTSMYPETYLIDREGRFARKIVGPQDWQSPEIMRSIDTVLNQK